jgi:hypothetical protein
MTEQTLTIILLAAALVLLAAALVCDLLYLAGVGARLSIWVIASAVLTGFVMAIVAGVL